MQNTFTWDKSLKVRCLPRKSTMPMISKFLDKPSRQAKISTSKKIAWYFRKYNWKEVRFCERPRNMIPELQAFCGMEKVEFSNATVR